MPQIHETAFVDRSARFGSDVEIGAYCFVGPRAEISDRVVLHPHAAVTGLTRLEEGCRVLSFASVGTMPQHREDRGERSRLVVGDHTTIGEHVTINRGTEGGGRVTKVGSRCLLMAGSHVAHDCQIGNHVVVGAKATLAGHVTVGDYANLGALSAVQQFVRIGAYASVGERSGIPADIIPFGMAGGIERAASLSGLNIVELERRGLPRDQIHELRQAYRLLFSPEGTLRERLADVAKMFGANPLVKQVVDFITSDPHRSFCVPNYH